VTLTPLARPLALNATFSISVAGAVTDRSGNAMAQARSFSFQTIAPDTTGPRVQSTSPAAGAVGAALATNIDVTFTEPVSPASVTPASFRVSVGGVVVPGSLTPLDGNGRVRFVPAVPFGTDAVVVVELSSAITDAAGNALVDANGQPLTGPFTFTFVTGSFGIVSPAPGTALIENTTITIEAGASSSLGIASVVFTVNGQPLAPLPLAPYRTTFQVPPVASTTSLTIVASARNVQGTVLASDTKTFPVGVALRATPSLSGIPLGGSRALRFTLSSPLSEDLAIQLRAGDPSIVSFPINPVTIPAGQLFVDGVVTGVATGNTAIFGDSTRGTADAVVSVGEVAPGQTRSASASPIGATLLSPRSAGVVTITTDVVPEWQPLAGLTSWWRGDGNALDAIGTNHGSLQNGAGFAAGKFGQAFNFDGVDDQIVVPHNSNLNAGTAITIAAWVNPASMGHGRPIAQKRSSGNVGGYTFEMTHQGFSPDNGLQWIVWINGAPWTLQTPPNVLQPGVWRHVAATYDGASMKIFVDGTQRASLAISGAVDDSSASFVVGRNVVVPSFAWHGLIDEVEVYQRPLNAAEIEKLARRGAPDPSGQTRTVDVVVLSTPSATPTNVLVTSSDPSVATATSGPIAAGSLTATLTITTGQAGTTTLIIQAGGQTRSVKVVVGGASPLVVPYLSAKPAGVSVLSPPSAGAVISLAGRQSAIGLALLASPAAAQTPVTVTSSNPAVATATAAAIPAGNQTTQVTVTAIADGVATIVLRAGTETRVLTVVVGTPAPNTIPLISARAVGVSTLRAPRGGELFAPTGTIRTIRVVVLAAPATSDTAVTITSSDPTIVSALSPAIVHAGDRTVDLQLTTNNSGTATLTLSVNGQAVTLDVAVGVDVAAERLPLIAGPPVGISVVRAGSAGQVIAPEGVVSLPTLKIGLLTAPAAAPVQVTVSSRAPSLVSFGSGSSTTATIAQGEQTIDLPLAIAGTRGAALLFFEFDGQRREMLVVVGTPPNSQLPLVTSPVLGVEVRQ
jgi:hypothetical protein